MLPAATLVHLETVAAVKGMPLDRVYQAVDDGELLWVFNLATKPGGLRELRVWSAELMNPSVRQLPLEQALARIIGTGRARLRGTELNLLLAISRPHLLRLCRTRQLRFQIEAHTRWVARDSLAAFLQKRWLGAALAAGDLPKRTCEKGSPVLSSN
jgi:hypothetical protein